MATDVFDELAWRGLVYESTEGLPDVLAREKVTLYIWFDPTAASLHVGSLLPMMALARMQRFGHSPIAIVGGGTGMIGDPSGKTAERQLLTVEQIDANLAGIRAQLAKVLDFDAASNAARIVNNADWLRKLNLLDFLRDTGKHFTVNYMLAKDSVKNRMETGISYTEFTYMLIQAYDFWHLWKTERCELQVGGSDQWGNITAGTELISRREGASAHGLVLPLLTTSTGAKFGKSEEGAIYLDPQKTSPYRFFQFWLNSDDRDVPRWLRYFTFFPMEEVRALVAEHERDPGKRGAQRRLAEEMTTRVHGAAALKSVVDASQILFGGAELRAAGAEVFEVLAREIPTARVPRAELTGLSVLDGLVRVGLASSRGDAKRGIQGKGFTVNGEVPAPEKALAEGDLLHGRYVMLQKGKRNHALLVAE